MDINNAIEQANHLWDNFWVYFGSVGGLVVLVLLAAVVFKLAKQIVATIISLVIIAAVAFYFLAPNFGIDLPTLQLPFSPPF
jgi:hypothetical protein